MPKARQVCVRRDGSSDPTENLHVAKPAAQSKFPIPDVYWFNPFAEGLIAYGRAYSPRKYQLLLSRDLANLPQFLCRPGDIVLVPELSSIDFLTDLKTAGFPLPEFIQLHEGALPDKLRERNLAGVRPWAWGPDSLELFRPLSANLLGQRPLHECFNATIAQLYSKAWSASLLRRVLSQFPAESWLCTAEEVGVEVATPDAALDAIGKIRSRGHQKVMAKEDLGLAGHNSLRFWEPDILPAQRRWLDDALQNGRKVVIEPWLDRELDFSIQLEMGAGGLELCGYTGLINDCRGQFQANWAAPDYSRKIPAAVSEPFTGQADLLAKLQWLYDSVFELLQYELRAVAYMGPLGIDAFVYRTVEGRCRIKPIVEVNPRYTMGRVTVELMKHAAPNCFGLFRLLSLKMLKAQGFAGFQAYAEHLNKKHPIILKGQPVPTVGRGTVCLNDPARAQVSLPTFQVLNANPPPARLMCRVSS